VSRLIKDSAVTFAAEAVTAVLTFANGVLLARALGPDGKGIYALAVTWGSLGALILGFRWQRPTGYFLARDEQAFPAIVGSNLLMAVVATVLSLLLWAAWPPLMEDLILPNAGRAVIAISIGWVASTFLWQAITAIYGGMRRFFARSVFLVVACAVQLVPTIMLYLRNDQRVELYLATPLATTLALYGGWIVWLLAERRAAPRVDWPLLSRMMRYASMAVASVLLDMVMYRLDLFILNFLVGPGPVGVYTVAVGLANQLARIPTILATVVFHRVSANEMGSGETTAGILRLSLLAMIGLGAVLALLGLLIVPIYGDQFAGAIPALYVMIPATVFLGLYRMLAADLDGRGRPGWVSLCSFISAVTIVVLDLWWIPRFGLMGAAWASLVAYAVAFGAGGGAFCVLTGQRPRVTFAPRREDLVSLVRAVQRLRQPGSVPPGVPPLESGGPTTWEGR